MRIREKDLVVPSLQIAASRSDGFISTSELILALEEIFNPDGEDAQILEGRLDTKFSQKVRNLVSHRNTRTSMFEMGYAVYDDSKGGIIITDAGRDFLSKVPE